MSRELGRRRALGLLAAGSAAVATGVAGWVWRIGAPQESAVGAAASGEPLRAPPERLARDGVLSVPLDAGPGVRLAGRDTSALGFNGSSPGPSLRVRPGDELRVRLTNRLGQPTNLHTHGLHVSPRGNSDNPFLSIAPGETFDYRFRIPDDHPPGTFWYHPHRHGSVADQLFGGLAGALIVDGGPELAETERVLVVTDISLTESGDVVPAGPRERMLGREGDLVLVNGRHEPTVELRPGAVERWRVINACTSRVLSLRAENARVTQVGSDGFFLPRPVPRQRVVLAPGNRADLLVTPTGPGSGRLVSDPVRRGHGGMPGTGGMADPVPGSGDTRQGPVTLVRLAASGPAAGTSREPPAELPAPPLPGRTVSRRREIAFTMGMGGMGGMGDGDGMRGPGMRFGFDGRAFDADRTDQTVAAGATEEWLIRNDTPMDHPFHLHVWPFQVVGSSDGGQADGGLRDVVLVPARGWARLRVRFADHTGRTVYHCHILDHEDAGMMATVRVGD